MLCRQRPFGETGDQVSRSGPELVGIARRYVGANSTPWLPQHSQSSLYRPALFLGFPLSGYATLSCRVPRELS